MRTLEYIFEIVNVYEVLPAGLRLADERTSSVSGASILARLCARTHLTGVQLEPEDRDGEEGQTRRSHKSMR